MPNIYEIQQFITTYDCFIDVIQFYRIENLTWENSPSLVNVLKAVAEQHSTNFVFPRHNFVGNVGLYLFIAQLVLQMYMYQPNGINP